MLQVMCLSLLLVCMDCCVNFLLLPLMYMCICMCMQEEQAAKLKADNIRVALEKIKEAQVKKVSQEKMKISAEIFVVYIYMLFMRSAVYSRCPADSVYGSGQCYSALKALVDNSWGQNTHTH